MATGVAFSCISELSPPPTLDAKHLESPAMDELYKARVSEFNHWLCSVEYKATHLD